MNAHRTSAMAWDTGNQRHLLRAGLAMVALQILLLALRWSTQLDVADASYYWDIARGQIGQIPAPFTNRAALPLLLGWLNIHTGVSLELAFSVTTVVAFVLFLASLLSIFYDDNLSDTALFCFVVLTPISFLVFTTTMLSDAMAVGLCATCLALLKRRHFFWAILLFGVAVLTRETNLLLIIFIAWMLYAERPKYSWLLALQLIVVTGVCAVALSTFKHMGLSNVHDMNELVYMLAKMPVNFLTEVLGITIWSDSMAWCQNPVATAELPAWILRFTGHVHKIGTCGVNLSYPVRNFALVASAFGVMPGLLAALIVNRSRTAVEKVEKAEKGDRRWLNMTLIYGLLMLVLGICSGKSVFRLIAHGWPLLVVGVPLLLTQQIRSSGASIGQPARIKILVAQCFSSVVIFPFELAADPNESGVLPVLLVVALIVSVGLQWFAYRTMFNTVSVRRHDHSHYFA